MVSGRASRVPGFGWLIRSLVAGSRICTSMVVNQAAAIPAISASVHCGQRGARYARATRAARARPESWGGARSLMAAGVGCCAPGVKLGPRLHSPYLGAMSDAPVPDRFDLSTPAGRAKAYADYLWNDHAYLRLGFSNAHWI